MKNRSIVLVNWLAVDSPGYTQLESKIGSSRSMLTEVAGFLPFNL